MFFTSPVQANDLRPSWSSLLCPEIDGLNGTTGTAPRVHKVLRLGFQKKKNPQETDTSYCVRPHAMRDTTSAKPVLITIRASTVVAARSGLDRRRSQRRLATR